MLLHSVDLKIRPRKDKKHDSNLLFIKKFKTAPTFLEHTWLQIDFRLWGNYLIGSILWQEESLHHQLPVNTGFQFVRLFVAHGATNLLLKFVFQHFFFGNSCGNRYLLKALSFCFPTIPIAFHDHNFLTVGFYVENYQ